MNKLVRYILIDIIRNRIVIAYMILLAAITLGVFCLEDNPAKGVLTILNIDLFIIPLVSIIFSAIYMYNSAEFIELLVSQPVPGKTIWLSLFLSLAGALSLAFLIGAGIPILIFAHGILAWFMILAGVMLTLIFVVLGLVAVVKTADKARGIGLAILLWVYFSILFDAVVLFLLFQFANYPVEKAMICLSMLNPVDLCRIMILLKMDVSALMGYSGAVFQDFFGTNFGILISVAALVLWVLIPLFYSLKKFVNKDL